MKLGLIHSLLICRFQNVFLVNAPGYLGMFVGVTGTSNYPPLRWRSPCLDVVFAHPYVLALHLDCVTVHKFVSRVAARRVRVYVCARVCVREENVRPSSH